ncbi:tape measure protein [Janthinobacterium sp. PAMC25594]|uniref:tape measure protein n=1 Tax=Janthinobacterium sp. PAMC25594 TaxID=2861284 RepID=UPI001C6261A1|nr:tape measure protein [Janthinobacterium sp. PAMC25594]QYG07173.1 tape measure protein [Janthinobacterium sp. PAMC25594]
MANESRVIITADSAQAIREFNRLRTQSTSSLRDIASYSDKVGAALGAIGMGTGLAAIVGMSDEYTKFTAQLRLATVSQNEYNAAYADVKRIATGSQQSLAGTGTLYARIANGTRELGTTLKQVTDITETVNLALRVSGATATESASAQLQLSQAFASGTLRGEEFNAVNEAAPRLMKALADGMGLPIGALKGLAGEGKITSQIMADVLPKALGSLREESKQIATIGGALTVAKDAFMELTAVKAQANGTVSALTTGIRLLSENMAILMGTITTLTAAKLGTWMGKWVTDTYAATVANKAAAASSLALAVTTSEASAIAAAAKLTEARATSTATGAAAALATARVAELRTAIAAAEGEVMLAIALNGLIPAEARATALAEAHAVAMSAEAAAATAATRATTAATVALTAQAAAATLATRAMGVLRGIMAFMGGPIGLIITALGAAAIAWSHYSNKAKAAAKETAEVVAETTLEAIDRLDKEIDKLKERNALRNAVPVAKQANDADKDALAKAKKNMEDAQNGVGRFSLRSKESLARLVVTLTADYNALESKIVNAQEERTVDKEGTRNDRIKDWRAKNGSAKDRMEAELAELRTKFGSIPADIEVMVRAKYVDKGAASALKQEENAYKSLVTSIQEKLEANKLEALGFENMTDAQKMTVKLNAAILADKTKLNAADIERARVLIAQVASEDAQLLSAKSVKKAVQELKDGRDQEAAAAYDEIEANKQAIATYGMSKAQIEALTLARMEDRLARRGPQDLDLDEAEVNHLMRMIGLQKEKAATAGTLGALDTGSNVAKAKELLDILTAVDAATKSAADGMAASFGKVGSAIGGLTTALSGYAVQQQAIAAQLATVKADPKSSADAIAKAEIAATRGSAQAKIKSYGDMAGAAKGFFKENTVGYKVMESTEKAFRAYEMAMAVESMVKKIFFKEAEVAANLTLNATKLTGEATTTAASTGLAATEASAWGITAVVKALASLPFPLNLAAGAATLAAVVAIGAKMLGGMGGSSVSLSEQRQAANGTGSVLGDSSAKSESIAHSLAIMEKNSGLGLAHTISMDQSLKQMVAGIGNLGNLLARSGITAAGAGATAGITTGSTPTLGKVGQGVLTGAATYGGAVLGGSIAGAMTMGTIGSSLTMMGAVAGPIGMAIGAAIGFVVSKLIKTSVSVKDSGITGAATSLGNVDALGFDAQAYADINVKKKAFGISYSSKNSTKTAALSDEMNDQFTMIITSMGDTIRSAADVLGLGGAAFNAHLNSFVVDLGKISLKDLSAEEQQKALETAFSKMGDDMAKFGVAGLAQYQAVGEGYLETLVRVTNDYIQVSDVLAVLGKSFNTTGLGAVALSESLITAAGGLETLTSGTSYFVENFLTEAERMAPITKSVNDAMGKLGISGVDTVDQFKALVLAQDLNTAAGQAMYVGLIGLAEPFKKAADYAAELAGATGDLAAANKTASEIASERRDLQQQLNELTKSETALLAIQRAGIADVNKALFDQVQVEKAAAAARDAAAKTLVTAKDALTSAYQAESSAAQSALDKVKNWVSSLNSMSAGLALGNLSTLTPEQKYAEARAQFEKTLAAARGGDAEAQSGLSAAEQAFLTASQLVNASSTKYAADYALVQAANAEALKYAAAQVNMQQASLDALKAQVSGLITVNASVLTVAQAIDGLRAAMGVATRLGVPFDGSHAGGLVSVPFNGYAAELHQGEVVVDAAAAAAMRRYFGGAPSQGGGNTDALVAEIRSLREENKATREELRGLRADQAKQTGDIILGNYDASDKAAIKQVAGAKSAAMAPIYAEKMKAKLV